MVEADDFARRFRMRAGNLMWLMGAGCSAAAGIPTAGDMIGEFKQQLYVSQRKVSLRSVSDLSNPRVREQLQSYFDASGRFPAEHSADEYAAFFEAAFPNEADRQAYMHSKVTGAKPSYGHCAIATLMKAGSTKIVWTTNFDPLTADACARVYDSTGPLTVADLDAPGVGIDAVNAGRWPIEIKLHGDFRSRRLKNTGDELRHQDAKLRQLLLQACARWGLVVAGYSGRDDSVMSVLEDALKGENPFPTGLFWLHRGQSKPVPRVEALLQLAAERGVDGGIVQVENFDEALRDLVRLFPDLDTKVLDAFGFGRPRVTPAPRVDGKKGFPIAKLNGLPILASPSVCRVVTCSIGGYTDIQSAVSTAQVDLIFGRKRVGVLAFGSDADVRKAFASFGITGFDLHPIEVSRLRYDSAERGLLREALSRALAREHDLEVTKRRGTDLLAPRDPAAIAWAPLKKLVGLLSGSIKDYPELLWREGIGVRLDWANENLWLLVEPRTVFSGVTEENRHAATDFARERTVRRYNRTLHDLIAFWATKLAKGGEDLRALAIGDGVDAVFRLGSETAFSKRITA